MIAPQFRSSESQEQQRRANAIIQRRITADIRDIGPPPKIVDEKRREACGQSLREFLLTYRKDRYALRFSADHENLIQLTENSLLHGGPVVCAMPRGSGKTTIFQDAIVWAVLYGHRRFSMLICSDDAKFKSLLDGIKTGFTSNQLLLEDFPEVVHPIRMLDNSPIRAMYQMCDGEQTYIKWGSKQIIFPMTKWTMERGNGGNSMAGGGLAGAAIRGAVLSLADGTSIRPDSVLCDDPQTRKSAKSETQVQEREDILKSDVLGMAGPDANMSLVVACTVIYRGDLAERLLDQDRSTEYKRVRVSMVKSWPEHMEMWETYHEHRRQELLEESPEGTARAYYLENQDQMDQGCKVYWEDRIAPGYHTAIEAAMARYLSDPRAFMAEMQNQPDETIDTHFVPLNSIELVQRQSHTRRGVVPRGCEYLTCHIDVQQTLLYWMVVAWTQKFGGTIIDFGHTPQQRRSHFTLMSLRKGTRLQDKFPDSDDDGSIRQGVAATIEALSANEFPREDGAKMRINLGLVDTRFKPTVVEEGISLAGQNGWMPAWGVGVGAKNCPLKLRKSMQGVHGDHYVIQKPQDRKYIGLFIDTNYWKSEAYNGLIVPKGHTHAVTFFKTPSASILQMPADHFCAERPTRVEAEGRKIDEWDNWKRHDNHHWDNLVGNFVAARQLGIRKESNVVEDTPTDFRGKRKVRF